LGVKEDYIKINPTISRGLNYYTGTVYETFIKGAEKM
jgi:histidyl-tRNA synthetase